MTDSAASTGTFISVVIGRLGGLIETATPHNLWEQEAALEMRKAADLLALTEAMRAALREIERRDRYWTSAPGKCEVLKTAPNGNSLVRGEYGKIARKALGRFRPLNGGFDD